MKASRLLSILMLLQARGRMTAPALAQAMEVSERTILRDIDQLSAAGVPLWGERGRLGGFQLQPGWSTRLTGMTEPEANALLLAGLPGPATELGLGAAAASARLKLVASLPTEWRDQAEQVGARLHIDPVDWYRAPDTPRYLREVAHAVWNSRRIRVDYESWAGAAPRDLEPLGLVLKAGAWYLAARTVGKDTVRTYRLAKVLALQPGSKGFRRPRSFDLAAFWKASSAQFEAQLRPLQAQVRVTRRGLNWLDNARLDYVPLPVPVPVPSSSPADATAKTGAPVGPDPAGWQDVLLPIESIEHGARQVLGFGAEMEVLSPPALRAEVLRGATALVALHAKA